MRGIKITLLVCLNLLLASAGFCQPVVQFNPAAIQQSFNGLFYFHVLNPEQVVYESVFEVVLEDHSGTAVLTIQSGKILIKPGNNLVNLSGSTAKSVQFHRNNSSRYLEATRRLPNGSYNYCVEGQLSDPDKNTQRTIFKCFPFDIVRPSELHLMMPEDKDTLCSAPPLLQWQPLLPFINGCEYAVKMVPLSKNESPERAIMASFPLFYQEGIRGNKLAFAQTGKTLRKGEQYAWQVYATVNKVLVASSEIWSFSYGCNDSVPPPPVTDYLLLSSLTNHVYFEARNGIVPLSFLNPYTAGKLKYEVKDLSSEPEKLSNPPVFSIETGLNKIALNLNEIPGTQQGKYYEIRLYGLAEEVLVVKVKFMDQ